MSAAGAPPPPPPAAAAPVTARMAIPERWRAAARPFLQRADELAAHEPAVAYFLRRHVLAACLHDRPANDPACNAFLLTLMNALEADAVALGAQAKDEYGKATLPLFGLKLFALADTAERRGEAASVRLVRQFFAAALLLEATAQFSDDGVTLDPDMATKSKYAKYVAMRMKRALDGGVPYVSANATTSPRRAHESSSLPPSATAPPPAVTDDDDDDDGGGDDDDNGGGGGGTRTTQQQQQQKRGAEAHPQPPPVPSYNPPPIVTTSTTAPAPTHAKVVPVVSPAVYRQSGWSGSSSRTGGGGGTPSIETMIDAQKYARQAVSALQFYDAANAVRQLREALRLLEGGGGGNSTTT